MRLADVCAQKTTQRPVRTPERRTASCSFAVTSVKPRPLVRKSRVSWWFFTFEAVQKLISSSLSLEAVKGLRLVRAAQQF
jgi:hypothetical protein